MLVITINPMIEKLMKIYTDTKNVIFYFDNLPRYAKGVFQSSKPH